MNWEDQAHAELAALQEAIGRHEGQVFTIRSWLLAVLAGLIASAFTEKIELPAVIFLPASLAAIVLLGMLELDHRCIVRHAINRHRAVEGLLQLGLKAANAANPGYTGSAISEHLALPTSWSDRFREFRIHFNLSFYLALALAVAAIGIYLPTAPWIHTLRP
jgi:hypothetical protein